MTIDRFGKRIYVGYALHELIWLEAAISLPTRQERIQAFHDIASMTGRNYASVRERAGKMAGAAWDVPVVAIPVVPVVLPPSAFTLSKAVLMAGRAPTRRAREILAAE